MTMHPQQRTASLSKALVGLRRKKDESNNFQTMDDQSCSVSSEIHSLTMAPSSPSKKSPVSLASNKAIAGGIRLPEPPLPTPRSSLKKQLAASFRKYASKSSGKHSSKKTAAAEMIPSLPVSDDTEAMEEETDDDLMIVQQQSPSQQQFGKAGTRRGGKRSESARHPKYDTASEPFVLTEHHHSVRPSLLQPPSQSRGLADDQDDPQVSPDITVEPPAPCSPKKRASRRVTEQSSPNKDDGGGASSYRSPSNRRRSSTTRLSKNSPEYKREQSLHKLSKALGEMDMTADKESSKAIDSYLSKVRQRKSISVVGRSSTTLGAAEPATPLRRRPSMNISFDRDENGETQSIQLELMRSPSERFGGPSLSRHRKAKKTVSDSDLDMLEEAEQKRRGAVRSLSPNATSRTPSNSSVRSSSRSGGRTPSQRSGRVASADPTASPSSASPDTVVSPLLFSQLEADQIVSDNPITPPTNKAGGSTTTSRKYASRVEALKMEMHDQVSTTRQHLISGGKRPSSRSDKKCRSSSKQGRREKSGSSTLTRSSARRSSISTTASCRNQQQPVYDFDDDDATAPVPSSPRRSVRRSRSSSRTSKAAQSEELSPRRSQSARQLLASPRKSPSRRSSASTRTDRNNSGKSLRRPSACGGSSSRSSSPRQRVSSAMSSNAAEKSPGGSKHGSSRRHSRRNSLKSPNKQDGQGSSEEAGRRRQQRSSSSKQVRQDPPADVAPSMARRVKSTSGVQLGQQLLQPAATSLLPPQLLNPQYDDDDDDESDANINDDGSITVAQLDIPDCIDDPSSRHHRTAGLDVHYRDIVAAVLDVRG